MFGSHWEAACAGAVPLLSRSFSLIIEIAWNILGMFFGCHSKNADVHKLEAMASPGDS